MRVLRLTLMFSLLASAAMLAQRGQGAGGAAQTPGPPMPPDTAQITKLKDEAIAEVDKLATFSQQMNDQIFSYGELGFQEVETHRYLVDVLKKNGFTIEDGFAGIPTAFVASWGSGKPIIALGSDIDCIPQASQKPGVGYVVSGFAFAEASADRRSLGGGG